LSAKSKIRELQSIVSSEALKSITVDVFDTLVLRDHSSEEQRFLEVATLWTPLARQHIHGAIDEWEIYSFRQFTRDLEYRNFTWRRETGVSATPEAEFEIRFTAWVEEIVTQLANKYDVTLSPARCKDLVDAWIDIEIAHEAQRLRPNTELIHALRQARADNGLQVYLVSDMYLSGAQLTELLTRLGVPVFDGVVTSSDVGVSKRSGHLFTHLETSKVFAEYSSSSNLHIGDRKQNDYDSPRARGSHALLYRTSHHELQRVGYRFSKWLTKARVESNLRAQRRAWNTRRRQQGVVGQRGALFGPSVLQYVNTYQHRARANGKVAFVAVSSEATYFEQLATKLAVTQPSNVSYFAKVNRATLLRGIEKSSPKSAARSAVSSSFVDEVRLQVESTANVDRASRQRVEAWPFESSVARSASHLALLDVGWMGTIQALVQELAKLDNRKLEVSGIYLGRFATANRYDVDLGYREGVIFHNVKSARDFPYFVPELWEYVLGVKAQYLEFGPHEQLQSGTSWAVDDWKANVRLSAGDFVRLSNPALRRMLWLPSSVDRKVLGSILWERRVDAGLGLSPLVPADLPSAASRYLRLVLHPRLSYRDFVTAPPHVWVAGYAGALKLRWFMRLSLIAARRAGHIDRRRY
jgi:FMN phosphatase YigB (HAD superfamily)